MFAKDDRIPTSFGIMGIVAVGHTNRYSSIQFQTLQKNHLHQG
jgi:hypothetical protein